MPLSVNTVKIILFRRVMIISNYTSKVNTINYKLIQCTMQKINITYTEFTTIFLLIFIHEDPLIFPFLILSFSHSITLSIFPLSLILSLHHSFYISSLSLSHSLFSSSLSFSHSLIFPLSLFSSLSHSLSLILSVALSHHQSLVTISNELLNCIALHLLQ